MITAMPRIAIAVEDYDATVESFREQFGMPVVDVSESTLESLGAKVGMCVPAGGSNIEIMSPGVPEAPLSRSLRKFLDRRGEGLFALMLEAPDPDAEAELLLGRELGVLPLMDGAGGRDVHPRTTHGVLIRVYPSNSFQGTTDDEAKEPTISGISRVMIAVADAASAARPYAYGFGLSAEEPRRDEERGLDVVTVRPPKGGEIEIVSVADRDRVWGDRIAGHLEEHPEGMYCLVLETPDIDAAASALESRGVEVSRGDITQITVNGTRLVLERACGIARPL